MTLNQGILYYLLVLNFGTFLLFWADKQKAVHRKWRIKEATLLGMSLLGGAAGGLAAMYLFHHKIKKNKFRIGVPALLAVQVVIVVWLKMAGV